MKLMFLSAYAHQAVKCHCSGTDCLLRFKAYQTRVRYIGIDGLVQRREQLHLEAAL